MEVLVYKYCTHLVCLSHVTEQEPSHALHATLLQFVCPPLVISNMSTTINDRLKGVGMVTVTYL